MGTIFLKKWYSGFVLTSPCLWSFTNDYALHKLCYTSLLYTYFFHKIHCDNYGFTGWLKNGFNEPVRLKNLLLLSKACSHDWDDYNTCVTLLKFVVILSYHSRNNKRRIFSRKNKISVKSITQTVTFTFLHLSDNFCISL